MPAKKKAPKTAKKAAKTAKPVTARKLLDQISDLLEQRGLDHEVIVGCLCEVISQHQPSARQAVARIAAMLDQAGIR